MKALGWFALCLWGAGCGRIGFEALSNADESADAAIEGLGSFVLAPTKEGCVDYFNASDGNLCETGPVRRSANTYAVFEFDIPSYSSAARIEQVVFNVTVDATDNDNTTAARGGAQFIARLGDNLSGGPAPSAEPIPGTDLNPDRVTPVPGPGGAMSFELNAGPYLRSGERVWLALRAEEFPTDPVLFERGTASLAFDVVAGSEEPLQLIDDSQLELEGERSLYPSFSGCRNLTVPEVSADECRYGGLKTDFNAPDTVVSYLHFEVPLAPPGKTLSSAEFTLHTTRNRGAEGFGADIRSTTPFTPTSLNTPGAANIPTDLETLALGFPDTATYAPVTGSLDTAFIVPGELYLSVAAGADAVFYYGHRPAAHELDKRPRLVLIYE